MWWVRVSEPARGQHTKRGSVGSLSRSGLWNDRERVAEYGERMAQGTVPTAVAVSTLDRCQPAVSLQSTDEYEHWGLTHFLLNGHHKLEAAASAGRPVQLLSLLAMDESLSGPDDHHRLGALRSQPSLSRGARSAR